MNAAFVTGADQQNNIIQALKNLSIIGALLMLAAWPRPAIAFHENVFKQI